MGIANSDLFRTESVISSYLNMTNAATRRSTLDDESAVLKHHEKLIRFIAIPFMRGGLELEDLLQEGRAALLRSARSWEAVNGSTLWTYARKAVFGAILRYATYEADEPARPNSHELSEEETDGSNPEKSLETAECVEIVSREMVSLSETERRVIRMKFYEDMDVRSIAERLSIPRSTAHDVLQGAIVKLRERMGSSL